MKKLGILVMAMVLVCGMSLGVLAYDYEDESSEFDVNVNIDTYAEFDLEDININTADGIDAGEFDEQTPPEGDDYLMQGQIVANYDYLITLDSEGLTSDDGDLNDMVTYYFSNAESGTLEGIGINHDNMNPGDDYTFNMNAESRDVPFEFMVDFDEEKAWQEFTAGEYSDTITVTLEAQ